MPRERSSSLPAVDYIKSAAILAVLVQHAVPAFFDRPWTPTEKTVFGIISFHVPTFLFISGFLSHAEKTVSWGGIGTRLLRIVPPYLVATAVAWAFGFVELPTLRRLVFVIVTGAALAHYYFVPMLILCVLMLPVLSRMSTSLLVGAVLLILVGAEWMWVTPAWRLGYDLFWLVRNPVLQFHLGFFLLGVIAARVRPTLEDLGTERRFLVMATAAFAVVVLPWAGSVNEMIFHPGMRALYTLSVMALIAAAVPRGPAPAWIRFLSEGTFTIYLYHWFAFYALLRLVNPGPPAVRVLVLTFVGLAFSTSVVLLGQRALGARSRLVLGT